MADIHADRDPDPRLRCPVHPADCAPRARARRVLRNLSLGLDLGRRDPGVRAEGRHPLRRPESVTTMRKACEAPAEVFTAGVPVLGICYGMQTMAEQLGGKVECRHSARIRLRRRCNRSQPSRLLDGIEDNRDAGRTPHARCVDEPRRPGHRGAAGLQGHRHRRDNAAARAMADEARSFYGLQFHPEVTHTPAGRASAAATSCARSAGCAALTGRRATSSRTRCARSARRSAREGDARPVRRRRFLGASRRCSTARSATSSPACSSITACCAWAKAIR